MCENGNLKLEPILKEVRLKMCIQLLLGRTPFMCECFNRKNKEDCLFFDGKV